VNDFKTRFREAKTVTINSEDNGLEGNKFSLQIKGKSREIRLTDHSFYDLQEIIKGKGTKIVLFPSFESLNTVEKLFEKTDLILNLAKNRKSAYVKIVTGVYKTVFAVESDIDGLDFPFDKWIFFGTAQSASTVPLRTFGENLLFLRS
jgi:hypothetical protein